MEETKFCPHCGASIPEGAAFCTKCGAKLDESQNTTYNGTYESNTNSASNYEFSGNSTNQSTNLSSVETYNTLTLVFGILSFFFGIIFSIVSLVLSKQANPADSKTKAGKIISIISLVLWAIGVVCYLIILCASLAQ